MRRPAVLALMTATLALSLGGCGDKDDGGGDSGPASTGADGADGASDGADGASDGADGASDGADGTDGSTELTGGCLGEGCDLLGVGEAAWALCLQTTGDASDTFVGWGETRADESPSGVALTCTSAALTESDCPGMCSAAGLDNPFYNAASNDCSCVSEGSTSGTLRDQMVSLACDPAIGDANVGAYGDASAGITRVASVTCRGGASGTGACEDVRAAANAALGGGFGTAVDYGAGCGLSE